MFIRQPGMDSLLARLQTKGWLAGWLAGDVSLVVSM